MSDDSDSFIKEVTEEVRQDQMYSLMKKWAPLILGGVALVVGGAAYWSWSTAQVQAAAEARGGALLSVDRDDPSALTALAGELEGEAQLLAEMSSAAALARADQRDAARTAYEAVATRTGLAPRYRDLARLQVARLTDGADGMAALDALIDEAGPYRLLALEERAARLADAGEMDKAHADLRTIIADAQVTAQLAARARVFLLATGGEVPDAPQRIIPGGNG